MLINYNNNHNQMSTLSPHTSYSQSILPNDIIPNQSSLSNLIDSVNNNNLCLHYSKSNSSFTQKIDELNLLFYIETERILSKSKCLTSASTSTSIQRQDNLLLILLFKQIRLYISEIDRLNWVIKENREKADALYKEAKEEKKRHRIEIGTKDKIISTLKESIVVLEQSLLSRLKTNNKNVNDNACIGDYSNNISQLAIDNRYTYSIESQSFDMICNKQQRFDHANSNANGRNGINQCESIVMSGSVIRNSLDNNNNKNRSNNGVKYKKKGNIRIIKDLKEAISKGKASSMEFTLNQRNSHIKHPNSNKGYSNGTIISNGNINSNGIVFKLKPNDFKLRNTFNTENNRYIEIKE